MKDIPIFTGCDGIATLILREIPYRGEGYVTVRSVFTSTESCLRECESFCRAVGAEKVYFNGNADFTDYPIYASLIEREIEIEKLPQTTACAVLTKDEEKWAQIYNEKFAAVPAAQTCRKAENAFDIFKDGILIGIGQIEGNLIRSVATVERGFGADCVAALAQLSGEKNVKLLCAEQNERAMRLYDRLGFHRGERKEVWYSKKTLAI